MPIELENVSLDPTKTSVRESVEEVGGRDRRIVILEGVLLGPAVEDALDAIADAASVEAHDATLSLRTGRMMKVRRLSMTRQSDARSGAAGFVLALEAEDAYEYADTPVDTPWNVTASGDTLNILSNGTVPVLTTMTLTANGSVINPKFSDGEKSMGYEGTVPDGETLIFDPATGKATLEGSDVTPHMTGTFLEVQPEGTTLTYTDDPASSHNAGVVISIHDRWW